MPKFHPTPLIQDCWSSIGNITFFHRNGQCYYKRKPYTEFRWHLSAKILLTAPGVGFNPGLMRTYRPASISPVSVGPTTNTRAVTFTVTAPNNMNEYQAHIRYRLIDAVTGFRNNWCKLQGKVMAQGIFTSEITL